MSKVQKHENLADDLLRGVPAIAQFIGQPERITFYQAEKGHIPVGKVGGNWVASKSRLRAFYAEVTAGNTTNAGS